MPVKEIVPMYFVLIFNSGESSNALFCPHYVKGFKNWSIECIRDNILHNTHDTIDRGINSAMRLNKNTVEYTRLYVFWVLCVVRV